MWWDGSRRSIEALFRWLTRVQHLLRCPINWGAANEQVVSFNHERVGRIAPERIAALLGPIAGEVVSSKNSGGEHVLKALSPRSRVRAGHRLEVVKRGAANGEHN